MKSSARTPPGLDGARDTRRTSRHRMAARNALNGVGSAASSHRRRPRSVATIRRVRLHNDGRVYLVEPELQRAEYPFRDVSDTEM